VIYSSLPILAVGFLEQDVNDRESLANPFLYKAGPLNVLFDRRSFYWSLLRGVLHATIIFFVPALALVAGGVVRGSPPLDVLGRMPLLFWALPGLCSRPLVPCLQNNSWGIDRSDYFTLSALVSIALTWVVNFQVLPHARRSPHCSWYR